MQTDDYRPQTFTINNDEAPPGMSFSQLPNKATYGIGAGTEENKASTTEVEEYAVQDGEEDFLEELRRQEKKDMNLNHDSVSSTDIMYDEENPTEKQACSIVMDHTSHHKPTKELVYERESSSTPEAQRVFCLKKRRFWLMVLITMIVAGVGSGVGVMMSKKNGSSESKTTNNQQANLDGNTENEREGEVSENDTINGENNSTSPSNKTAEDSSMVPSASPIATSMSFCSHDIDCETDNGGACALESWTVSADRVCCISGSRTGYLNAPDYDVSYLSEYYCTGQGPGEPCFDSTMCAHGKSCVSHICQGE